MSEAYEVLRAFFRKWSTTDLTPHTRRVLTEDVQQLRIILEVYGHEDPSALHGCLSAPSRTWFALQYEERFLQNERS